MKTNFKNRVFWAKNALLRRAAIAEYAIALANEKLSQEDLKILNWRKRKEVARFAYHNSRFYTDLYKSKGFDPGKLKSESDWARVPILERSHIKQRGHDLLSDGTLSKYRIRVTTGGSTGVPIRTYRDNRFNEEILKWRMLMRWGCSLGEDQLMLWRIPPSTEGHLQELKNRMIWFPTRRCKIDASRLDSNSLARALDFVTKHRPRIIWGYVGAIDQFADFVLDQDLSLSYDPLVWVTASPITNVLRTKISKAFSPYVLDQYGCSEIHWIAASLPDNNNLIVEYDYRHVEVVDSGGQEKRLGEYGDLLISDLTNRVFPLIRYRVGDRAALLPDRVQSYPAFPVISPVKGRVSESIRSPCGRTLTGEYITTVFDDYVDHVRQFQVHQREDYSVDLFVVPTGTSLMPAKSILSSVAKQLGQKLGSEVPVNSRIVDELPHDMGKLRFVKSDLKEHSK